MENPYKLISELIEDISGQRTQDVIRRRFGLFDGEPKTLQEIGEQYNITRERVRQIEKNGLDHLSQASIMEKIKPLEDEIRGYFGSYGDLRREEKVYDDLVCYCFPASKIEEMVKAREKELQLCRAALNLILTLGKPFEKFPEDEMFYTSWLTDKNAVKQAKKAIDSAAKFLEKNRKLLNDEELYQVIKKAVPGISDKAALSYVDAAKDLDKNYFGEFGMIAWPEISPRGVRDKAYLILKKENRPLHFSEVTDLINKYLPEVKPAYMQTVHNELIKDPRFVLIGRGIYALAEWGYEPGTVVDVIQQVLKDKGPLTKEEILKNVLAKRLIKENTVLINLQNKKYFKRLEDGRFAIGR